MQCKCGAEMASSRHNVKTLSKAREWFDGINEDDLPITVNQSTCPACGRLHYSITTAEGKLK